MNTEIIKNIKNEFLSLIKGVEGYCTSFVTEDFMRASINGKKYIVKDAGIDLFRKMQALLSLKESLTDEIAENRAESNYIPFLNEMWQKIEDKISGYDNNTPPKLFDSFTDDGVKVEVYPNLISTTYHNDLMINSVIIGANIPNQKIEPKNLARAFELVYRQYKNLIESIQPQTNNQSIGAKNIFTTFKIYGLTDQQIKNLRNNLISRNLIKKITESDFIYLFSGQSITTNMKRIKPIKDNWNKVLFSLLKMELKIKKINYKTVNACFDLKKELNNHSGGNSPKQQYAELKDLLKEP